MDDVAGLMRTAVETLDALAKAVSGDDALPSEMVRLSVAVSAARGELYQALIAGGWTAPGGVLEGIALDGRLAVEGTGSSYDDRAERDDLRRSNGPDAAAGPAWGR